MSDFLTTTDWLNGYIPLAASRNGTADGVLMIGAVNEMLDMVFALAEQRGGWLGPMGGGSNAAGTVHDPWSVYRFLTCLAQWWELTADPRVGPAMFRFAGLFQRFLDAHPLNIRPTGTDFAGGGTIRRRSLGGQLRPGLEGLRRWTLWRSAAPRRLKRWTLWREAQTASNASPELPPS